jgi:predicted 3-demethylubiquinone-9 3-methyltransferase (glyoxalase superfamily)
MQKIKPFLWFNDDAEGAVNHYVSIFKKSRIISVAYLWRRRARAEGNGHDDHVSARGPGR